MAKRSVSWRKSVAGIFLFLAILSFSTFTQSLPLPTEPAGRLGALVAHFGIIGIFISLAVYFYFCERAYQRERETKQAPTASVEPVQRREA